jgi:hypothetical protein
VQKGSLLKIVEADLYGVADICPKPELGDLNLSEEISKEGPLFKRAIQLATEDLMARKAKKSLLLDKPIKNNFLITNYKSKLTIPENCSIKVKGDANVSALADYLNTNFSKAQSLRIDFNGQLKEDEFNIFLKLISVDVLKKVEYIEDPTVVSEHWAIWNKQVPLASDFQKTESAHFFKYRIIKPAREVLPNNLKHFTLTSAMDHPVGVAHGLKIAQQAAQNDSGFLTLDLYEDCGFNKYYNQEALFLNFSNEALADFGIGMTEELNKLKWLTLDRMLID